MEIDYAKGTLLWYWYEDWVVVGGFAVVLVVMAWVTARSGWGAGGLLIKGLMISAVLAVLPLTLIRLGVDIEVSDDSTLGYLSLAGAISSLVIGLPYLVISWPLKDEVWVRRIVPVYRTAAGVCAHYHSKMTTDTLAEEQMTAISLVTQELPPALKAIQVNSRPRSSEARRVKRGIERALRDYISSAKLAMSLFAELPRRHPDAAVWENVSHDARDRIVVRISLETSAARQNMADASAYFNYLGTF